jgi:3-deoxy-D-arabino-heptulosonate 7-phosphate (DAHP) synthase
MTACWRIVVLKHDSKFEVVVVGDDNSVVVIGHCSVTEQAIAKTISVRTGPI